MDGLQIKGRKTQECEERYGMYQGILEDKMFVLHFFKAKPFLEASLLLQIQENV